MCSRSGSFFGGGWAPPERRRSGAELDAGRCCPASPYRDEVAARGAGASVTRRAEVLCPDDRWIVHHLGRGREQVLRSGHGASLATRSVTLRSWLDPTRHDTPLCPH